MSSSCALCVASVAPCRFFSFCSICCILREKGPLFFFCDINLRQLRRILCITLKAVRGVIQRFLSLERYSRNPASALSIVVYQLARRFHNFCLSFPRQGKAAERAETLILNLYPKDRGRQKKRKRGMESSSPSVPFPLLQTPIESNYRACTIPYRFPSDNPRKATPVEIQWIDLFLNSVPSFRSPFS